MSWAEHHKQSESYANEADTAFIRGDVQRAAELYRLAAEAEASALKVLDPSKVRTVGITAVSATALWHKAGDYQQSKQFAEQWLTHSSLPLFAVDQLQELLEDCHKKLSLNTINQRAFRKKSTLSAYIATLELVVTAWSFTIRLAKRRPKDLPP